MELDLEGLVIHPDSHSLYVVCLEKVQVVCLHDTHSYPLCFTAFIMPVATQHYSNEFSVLVNFPPISPTSISRRQIYFFCRPCT